MPDYAACREVLRGVLAVGVRVSHCQGRHIHNPANRGTCGENVHRLSRAEQNRSDRDVAAGCGFEQVVSDIGRIDIG